MAQRNYPANTQIQKFLEESYNKERDQRLKWHYKRGSAEIGQSKQFEVFRRNIQNESKPEGLLSKLPKNVKEARYNKTKKRFDDTITTRAGSAESISAEMRPVTPSTTKLLYDGFTKEGKGRYQYLEARSRKDPEEKFEFPVSYSMEYGWRLGDMIKKDDIKKPPHGRTRIVADTFYTRTGIPAMQQPQCIRD